MAAVKTTSGENFTDRESALMAFMVYKRFGRNAIDAVIAWRRLLQNNCPDYAFWTLVEAGEIVYQEINKDKVLDVQTE